MNLARKGKETKRKKDKITRDETPHNPQSFRLKTFRPFQYDNKPISSTSSTITRDTSNKNTKNSSNGQGFLSDVENWVTTETNVDLTKNIRIKT